MESDLPNNTIGRVNGEKVKKKKKRKKNTNLHELAESSKVQTEKHNEKKKEKNIGQLENTSLQTATGKKKKRKKDEGGKIVVSGEASMDGGVTSLHQERVMKAPAEQSREPQGSVEEKSAKAKKKRANVTETNCEEEQPVVTPKPEEVPHMSYQGSDFPALLTGTKKHQKRKRGLDKPTFDSNLLIELKEFCPKLESKSPDEINKMIIYDLPRFKAFRKQGRVIVSII